VTLPGVSMGKEYDPVEEHFRAKVSCWSNWLEVTADVEESV
jgi:hypothetical protein